MHDEEVCGRSETNESFYAPHAKENAMGSPHGGQARAVVKQEEEKEQEVPEASGFCGLDGRAESIAGGDANEREIQRLMQEDMNQLDAFEYGEY